ncbi:transcriptional regulator [Clostridium perfringens A]|uniref:helix-turn-helix domain-containing protein n=1 Tax=Clostridium perfringens TaxID=1502 RepID=UPI001B837C3F|nr:helix-turn-helix domain-containing protein [Clostridium perfringens]HBC2033273.1 helix-turn-helix domain-containing protein [Clostridium perfringens]HBC2056680.1 helix-turn-helix domain-containing protein [Clostridium perfringens]HBC2070800.1 helix-turn-helix domain-containing protein [Clostridium perfringens]
MRKEYNNNLLPFEIIAKSTKGDAESINQVLDHFSGYIAKMSVRKIYDDFGNIRYTVDEDISKRIENKLVSKILLFRIDK